MAPDVLHTTLISLLTIVEARTASAHAIAAAARAAADGAVPRKRFRSA